MFFKNILPTDLGSDPDSSVSVPRFDRRSFHYGDIVHRNVPTHGRHFVYLAPLRRAYRSADDVANCRVGNMRPNILQVRTNKTRLFSISEENPGQLSWSLSLLIRLALSDHKLSAALACNVVHLVLVVQRLHHKRHLEPKRALCDTTSMKFSTQSLYPISLSDNRTLSG